MNLKNPLVPEGTRRIIRHQFKNLELEEILLPEGLEWIGAHCFRNSKLRRLILPSTVTRIDFGAFSSCDNLEEVVLPEGIRKIGPLAFSECENLKTVVNYPKSGMGERAFYEYRLSKHCCPYCGAPMNNDDQCSARCEDPYDWSGSLRLYKGLFWLDGQQLITVKIHVDQTGRPAYSVYFFGKRDQLGCHKEEWERLKKHGNQAVNEQSRHNEFLHGRVEINNFKATVFLHPDLNTSEIRKKICREFGLSKTIQQLDCIRYVINCSDCEYKNNNT